MSFAANWDRFVISRVWEDFPPELCVRLQWSGTPHLVSALSVLRQPGGAFGCTFYFDVRAFDAMWSGEPSLLEAVTAIATEDAPRAQVLRLHHSQPVRAEPLDVELLGAAIGLLFRHLDGDGSMLVLTDGSLLSLHR